jgi:HK97 family phage portal protein
MGIFDTFGSLFGAKSEPMIRLELKRAFDAARVGVAGIPQSPDTDRESLIRWSRKNELVYACIRKKCEAAADPEIIVERKNGKGEWEPIDAHPMIALLEKPNPNDTFESFLAAWVSSEETAGEFFAEIVRKNGVPTALYPLDPSRMFPVPDTQGNVAYYEFRSADGSRIRLEVEDVLHRRKPDLLSHFHGLSPLRVAIGSVDADQSQTDFTRAFFHSDGIPAGLLKVKNAQLSQEDADRLQQGWMAKFRRGGTNHKQVAVLDENADFQQIGSKISDIQGDSVRGQSESRICMVFGVPPILVGAYVGLMHVNQRASAREAQQDFWINTMSPMLKAMRTWLTWNLLPEFESIDQIRAKRVRVNFDMSQVMAMQEDEDARHDRARKNFQAGGITINEFRELVGMEPIDGEDYFLQPKSIDVVSEEGRQGRIEIAAVPAAQPQQLTEGNAPPQGETVDGEIVEDGAKFFTFERLRQHLADNPCPVAFTDCESVKKKKTYEFNGLTLAREPNEIEALLDLKGMVEAYDSRKEKINRVLIGIRNQLIKQAVGEIRDLSAGDVYTLTLTPPVSAATKLRKEIEAAIEEGREQVRRDLLAQSGKKSLVEIEAKKRDLKRIIERLVETLLSRVVNEIQTRAVNIFTRLATLGLEDREIGERLEDELDVQSTKVFESYAAQTANAAINAGRDEEAEERRDEWVRVEYSAILDRNTCEFCEEADGMSSEDVDDLPPAPNPDCEGGAQCRCFHVFVAAEGNA